MGWLTRGVFTLMAVLVVAAPAQADDRWAFTEFPGSGWYWNTSGAADVEVQPDGKIVLAGSTSEYNEDLGDYFGGIALARYNADLSLDRSFSADGKQTTDVDADRSSAASDVMIQPDGRILVAGSTGRSPVSDFVLVRYRSDGALDTSFAGDGIVTTDLGFFERANAAALQADGKIVVVGESIMMDAPESPWRTAIVRYRSDGSLDPSFSGDGVLTLNVHDSSNGEALVIQRDGKLLVGGGQHVLRLTPNGSLDPLFGTSGVVFDDAHYVRALALQSDGRIVTAGNSGRFAFARYLPDGSLDRSFGTDGRGSADFGEYGGSLNGVAIEADDNIVAVGEQYWSDFLSGNYGTNVLAARLDANGRQAAFGWANLPPGQEQAAAAVTITPNGHVVVAGSGSTWSDYPNRFLVGRISLGD